MRRQSLELVPRAMHQLERLRPSDQPFRAGDQIRPRADADFYHYAVMIPDLPAPIHFLDMLLVVGLPRAEFFVDLDDLGGSARETVDLFSCGGGLKSLKRRYPRADVEETERGLRIGNTLSIRGSHPEYTVEMHHADIDVHLDICATDRATWFMPLGALYTHIVLLSEYEGTIAVGGQSQRVSGLCSFEYAYGHGDRLLGSIPTRYFSYQVMNLDDRSTQIVVADVRATKHATLVRKAHVKSLDDHGRVLPIVRYTPLELRPMVDPNGHEMAVPVRWRWELSDGEHDTTLEARATTPLYHGLGRGYAGGFEFQGTHDHGPISGTGYYEYVDVR